MKNIFILWLMLIGLSGFSQTNYNFGIATNGYSYDYAPKYSTGGQTFTFDFDRNVKGRYRIGTGLEVMNTRFEDNYEYGYNQVYSVNYSSIGLNIPINLKVDLAKNILIARSQLGIMFTDIYRYKYSFSSAEAEAQYTKSDGLHEGVFDVAYGLGLEFMALDWLGLYADISSTFIEQKTLLQLGIEIRLSSKGKNQ